MKFKSKRNIIKTRDFISDFFRIAIGTIIMAAGLELFLIPNQLSTGGFSGIAIIIYYILKVPVGTTILLLNIPLFIIAYFKVGKEFFAKAVIGTIFLSIFLNAFEKINPITEDRFLAFLYGSVIVGIGTAMVLKVNGSTGGTDLLANIIRSFKPHLKTGSLIVALDTIIIIANTFFFKDIEVGLYSALAIYILGKILDIFFEGINFTKMLIIISPKWEEISKKINEELRRGTTALYGEGMYTKEEKKLLLCIMSRSEIVEARKLIEKIDPTAFVIISNAREVYGKGFKET
jgi:uncharacterized membrane-anchored protein YitT (DUF2179 family)